jgi:hypothetical protein
VTAGGPPQPRRPMPRGGGTTRAEVLRRTVHVEKLLLRGLDYLAVAEQLGLHKRVVQRYIGRIREDWAARYDNVELRHELIAKALDIDAQAAVAIASLPAAATVRVGYFNTRLKAQERVARLVGAEVPVRTELSGPAGGPLAVEEARPISLDEIEARLAVARRREPAV